MALMNIANSGRFAADRSIAEYAQNIWRVKTNFAFLKTVEKLRFSDNLCFDFAKHESSGKFLYRNFLPPKSKKNRGACPRFFCVCAANAIFARCRAANISVRKPEFIVRIAKSTSERCFFVPAARAARLNVHLSWRGYRAAGIRGRAGRIFLCTACGKAEIRAFSKFG